MNLQADKTMYEQLKVNIVRFSLKYVCYTDQ